MGMLDEFIKLQSVDGNKIYLHPADITRLEYDDDRNVTTLAFKDGMLVEEYEVRETPGVICDMCDKVLRKKEVDTVVAYPPDPLRGGM